MTRKDFVLIARALLDSRPTQTSSTDEDGTDEYWDADGNPITAEEYFDLDQRDTQWGETIASVTDALATTNPRFDRERFTRAAMGLPQH